MTDVVNPKTLSWQNATSAVDQNGVTVAWDEKTEMKGIEVQFDGGAAIEIDCGDVNTYSLLSIPAFVALPNGTHTVDMAIIGTDATGGRVSAFTPTVTFQVDKFVVPGAPTNLVVA